MAIETTPPEPDLPIVRKPLRSRPFWRLFGWGSAASIALAVAAITSQTEAGNKRLQLALAHAGEPVRAIAQIPPRRRMAIQSVSLHRCAISPPTASGSPPASPCSSAASRT